MKEKEEEEEEEKHRMGILKKLEQLFWKEIPGRCYPCLFIDYGVFFQNIWENIIKVETKLNK
jgi:hypothetical protein